MILLLLWRVLGGGEFDVEGGAEDARAFIREMLTGETRGANSDD